MTGLEKLRKWIEENSTVSAFAEAVPCTPGHVRNVLAGRKKLTPEYAKRFSAATNHDVKVAELLPDLAKILEAAE